MSTWNKWRVIITSTQEEAFVVLAEDNEPPTTGPNGEAIDTDKSRIVETREENLVRVSEMTTKTNTYYQVRSLKITAAANTTESADMVIDTDVNMISVITVCEKELAGDAVRWEMNPQTTAGVLTVGTSSGDTVLNVSPTVSQNAQPLFEVRLVNALDPTQYTDIGMIDSVDRENHTITLKTALGVSYPASTTLVQLTMVYVRDVDMPRLDGQIVMGNDKIGASYLPKGTIVRCIYTNNHAQDEHTMYVYFRYMYGDPE